MVTLSFELHTKAHPTPDEDATDPNLESKVELLGESKLIGEIEIADDVWFNKNGTEPPMIGRELAIKLGMEKFLQDSLDLSQGEAYKIATGALLTAAG